MAIYRIHRVANLGWWFSSDGSGRFDPVSTGLGACYFAEQPLGAWVEVFRKRMLLAEAEMRERSLMSVVLGRPVTFADLTSRRALAFGHTAALGTADDYGDSQAFAAEAQRAGFDGVRYWVQHDPRQTLHGLAIFGDAGAADPADPRWPPGDDLPLDDVRAEAQRRFGYRVLPEP